jgi:hypothetical protein
MSFAVVIVAVMYAPRGGEAVVPRRHRHGDVYAARRRAVVQELVRGDCREEIPS